MSLPETVHTLTQTVERGDRTVTIHPVAVETPRGVLLVDVGYPGELDQVEAGLGAAGLTLDDVTAVLLTHQDGDHAGGLAALLDRTDATVYAHQNCAPYVDGREHPIKSPAGERYPPAPVDVQLVGGEQFRTDAGPMDVVFTPGHAPGHLSLHFPEERLLLAADALTADESGLAGPSERFTPEMAQALDSAAGLAERDIDQILCFHGGLVAADGDRIATVVEAAR
jgi:glyoxylase-like metal-dependent hydrolase (beta-lactamase superfamily II)